MAQAAVKNQVRGFLQASSCAAYDQLQVPGKDNISEDFPLGKGNSPFYYWNTKCKCEKILSDTMASSKVTLTVFRLGTVIGPSIPISLQVLRQDALEVPGIDCRVQYIHEDDVAQVFAQAIRTPMPGAFNVVPDDFVRTSEYHKIIGAKIVTAPLWLALFVTYIRWRFFGSIFHPSWIRAYMMDFTLSNAKLKATGWEPKYTGEEAIRTVLGKRAGRKKTKKRLESSSVQ